MFGTVSLSSLWFCCQSFFSSRCACRGEMRLSVLSPLLCVLAVKWTGGFTALSLHAHPAPLSLAHSNIHSVNVMPESGCSSLVFSSLFQYTHLCPASIHSICQELQKNDETMKGKKRCEMCDRSELQQRGWSVCELSLTPSLPLPHAPFQLSESDEVCVCLYVCDCCLFLPNSCSQLPRTSREGERAAETGLREAGISRSSVRQ